MIEVVRRWAARLGTVQLIRRPASPVISVRLEGVDIEGVLENAEAADTHGARRQQIRSLLCEALGVSGDVGLDGVLPVTSLWRGTRRTVELAFGAIRDPADLGDAMFRPTHAGWRVVFGYPIDEQGHVVAEDLDRAADLRQRQPARAVCWVPRRLDLADRVRPRHGMCGCGTRSARASSSSPGTCPTNDRAIARQQMTALAEQLRSTLSNALLQAYGVITPDDAVVDTAHGGVDMFVSLEPGLLAPGSRRRRAAPGAGQSAGSAAELGVPRPSAVPGRGQAAGPAEGARPGPPGHRGARAPGHGRVRPSAPLMRRIANPLRLGEQYRAVLPARPSLGEPPQPQDRRSGHPGRDDHGRGSAGLAGRPAADGPAAGDRRPGHPDLRGADQPQHHRRRTAGGRQRAPAAARGRARCRAAACPARTNGRRRGNAARRSSGLATSANCGRRATSACSRDRVRAAAASRLPAARQLRDLLLEKGPGRTGRECRSGQHRPGPDRRQLRSGCARNWPLPLTTCP